MYKRIVITNGSILRNTSKEGETIERVFERMKNGNETNMEGKEMIYTRPENGIAYGTDIRDDKFEKGLENTARVTEHIRNARVSKYEERKKALEEVKGKKKGGESGEGESVQAGDNN